MLLRTNLAIVLLKRRKLVISYLCTVCKYGVFNALRFVVPHETTHARTLVDKSRCVCKLY